MDLAIAIPNGSGKLLDTAARLEKAESSRGGSTLLGALIDCTRGTKLLEAEANFRRSMPFEALVRSRHESKL